MEGIDKSPILRVTQEDRSEIEGILARESCLYIVLNGQELATSLYTPINPDYLAVGFLFSEGLILEAKTRSKR